VLQAIYLRIPDGTISTTVEGGTSVTQHLCINSNTTEEYYITAKDNNTVWDNSGAVTWDNFFDAAMNRSATSCENLSGDGHNYELAEFVG
jgi:hypothetical protein